MINMPQAKRRVVEEQLKAVFAQVRRGLSSVTAPKTGRLRSYKNIGDSTVRLASVLLIVMALHGVLCIRRC